MTQPPENADNTSGRATDPPVELTIDAIIAGGDGIGRLPDGPVVFVPRVAPGERISAEFTEIHRQWRRARVVDILEASPARRDPPCPHYGACGGCQLQHLDYPAQRRAKGAIVSDSLRRLGGLDAGSVDVVASERELGYRNRVTFVLHRDGDETVAGFHAYDDSSRIIDVDQCPLAEPAINRAWQSIRASWGPRAERLPAGRELRLTLRATADGKVGLVVGGARDTGEPEQLLEHGAELDAIWSLDARDAIVRFAGREALLDRWNDIDIPVSGASFLQVNRYLAPALDQYVLQQCRADLGTDVIDGYCGYGIRSIAMARLGAHVVGIDHDRLAIASAKQNAAHLGVAIRFVADRIESALTRRLPVDAVVLNPPRRGLGRATVTSLLRKPPNRIIYVSCDPATLARDLKGLTGAFDISACLAFDLFPQTAHVETVVTLHRRERREKSMESGHSE